MAIERIPRRQISATSASRPVSMSSMRDLPRQCLAIRHADQRAGMAHADLLLHHLLLHRSGQVEQAHEVGDVAARFADDAGRSIERARPNLPYALNDRAQDNWEPLLAIADHIGGDWPDIARRTALRISGAEREAQSLSTELLVDIRNVFDGKQVPRIKTADLLMALAEDENRPWATYNRGKPMVATQLAKRLAEYGIKPSTMRIDGPAAKGYSRADFDDTFRRYLSPCADTPSAPVAPLQIAKSVILSNTPSVTESHACGDIENPSVTPNLLIDNDCYGATAKTGEAARNAVEIEI